MGLRVTGHAKQRKKERQISSITKDINEIINFPVYTRDNGCTKYLDLKNNIVYYVRKDGIDIKTKNQKYKIVTMIKTNPIQMLRYYAFGKNLDFKCLCRDNAFHNCSRGDKCKYIHIHK